MEDKIRAAIPRNPLTEKFIDFDRIGGNSSNIETFVLDEALSSEMLSLGRVELALLTPLQYSRLINNDLRIIPTYYISLYGYSNVAGIFFKKDLRTIAKAAYSKKDEFLGAMMSILLSEKHDLFPDLKELSNNSDFDAFIDWIKKDEKLFALDISEEWADISDIPLPFYFWCVRNDDALTPLKEAIPKLLKESALQEGFEIIDDEEDEYRSGRINYIWNDNSKTEIEEIIKLLFFRQFIEQIAEVKILGQYESQTGED